MAPRKRDAHTGDLFAAIAELGEPEVPVERFDEEAIRAPNIAARMSRAVSAALREAEQERAAIATAMSDWLGETVTVSMIESWASQAKTSNRIHAERLIALCVVINDWRPLMALLEPAERIVVDAEYEHLIADEMLKEQEERIAALRAQSSFRWKTRKRTRR
jgi:hypothetical protein